MKGFRPLRRGLCALLTALLLATPAAAQESTTYNGITGFGSALTTIVYSPLKLTYAATGLVVTGLAWMWSFGDTRIAGPLLRKTVRGDYVVTPSHLEGRRSLRFVGK